MRFLRAKLIKKEWKKCNYRYLNPDPLPCSMLKQLQLEIINNSFAISGFSFALICPYANKEAATFNVALTNTYLIM